MFTRVIILNGVQDIDEAVNYLRNEPLSLLQAQRGYQGLSAGADRSNGILAIASLWATAADRDASESALAKTRETARQEFGGGSMTVESLDQLVVHISQPTKVGSALGVTRFSMDPGRVAENVEYFQREIVPQITGLPGFRTLRNLINPQTGAGLVSTTWDDERSRTAALEAAEPRRAEAVGRGVTFGETILAEIVFTDLS